jgi:hypothetical protein
MKNFNIEGFKNREFAVRCRTKKEAENFIEFIKINSIMPFRSGKTNWGYAKEKTAYSCSETIRNVKELNYGSCDLGYSEYKKVEWSDYMEQEFAKEDLKPCMVVKFRTGELGLVVQTQYRGICIRFQNSDNFLYLSEYMENLKKNDGFNCFDIIQVYGFSEFVSESMRLNTENRELLWERKEQPTKDEQIKQLLEDYKQKSNSSADELLKMIKEKLEDK